MKKNLEMLKKYKTFLERKCFAVDNIEFGQTERFIDVINQIDNEKAVECIMTYIEKARKYCESQGISYDDIATTLYLGVYYDGESSEITFDEVKKKEPIRLFYKARIGCAAYSSETTRVSATRHHDPVCADGWVFVDDATKEFGLGDLCTEYVITYDGFKSALEKMGYVMDEECTRFGGFDSLKNNASSRVLIRKNGKTKRKVKKIEF